MSSGMYSARVEDADEEDDFFAAAFADFDQRDDDEDDDFDEVQAWDIAAFSKISVVTGEGNDKAAEGDDEMIKFDVDFPDSFGFPGSPAASDAVQEKSEEESEVEDDKQDENEVVVEDAEEDDVNEKEEVEEDEEKVEEKDEEIPKQAPKQAAEQAPKQADISEERAPSPIAPYPMTLESNRSMSSDEEEESAAAPVVSKEVEEKTETEVSDVWANVVDAVQSANTAANTLASDLGESTRKFSMQVSENVLNSSGSDEGDSSVPTVASSSFDSSTTAGSSNNDDESDDESDDDESVADKSTGSKSASKIRALFAKIKTVKSADGNKSIGSVKSSTSKDAKSATSNGSKKKKMKLKGMSFRTKENGDTKNTSGRSTPSGRITPSGRLTPKLFKKKDDGNISDDDDVVESSPERQTRVYKIMRKKPKSTSSENTSFIEDLAEEFFTCSYFFKCLGDEAVKEGEEAKDTCCTTVCCRGSPGDVGETIEVHDEPDEVLVRTSPTPEDSPSAVKLPAGFLESWRSNQSAQVS